MKIIMQSSFEEVSPYYLDSPEIELLEFVNSMEEDLWERKVACEKRSFFGCGRFRRENSGSGNERIKEIRKHVVQEGVGNKIVPSR